MREPGDIRRTAEEFAEGLLDLILSRGNGLPRTYGFEYEFLPERILKPGDLSSVQELLYSMGQGEEEGVFHLGELGITFEPGGQIEYLSPPLTASDDTGFRRIMDAISASNRAIADELGIRYIGTGFIPGRYSAPLLLTTDRYRNMHTRFMNVDRRGPDMMKGTAAVHLHAAMTSVEDVRSFYLLFTELARGSEFGMSMERRSIWDATDACRCGLPAVDLNGTALSILSDICVASLEAVEMSRGLPFADSPNRDFSAFLDHLTTMFTDVRFNVKGGTLELRTLDSLPVEDFTDKWRYFTGLCERIGTSG